MRNLIILLVLVSLVGCHGHKQRKRENRMTKVMNSWIGEPVPKLISSWGIPGREYKNTDGTMLYEYSESNTVQRPTYSPPTTSTVTRQPYSNQINIHTPAKRTYGGGTKKVYCTYTFFAKDNVVTSWQWEGNRCF